MRQKVFSMQHECIHREGKKMKKLPKPDRRVRWHAHKGSAKKKKHSGHSWAWEKNAHKKFWVTRGVRWKQWQARIDRPGGSCREDVSVRLWLVTVFHIGLRLSVKTISANMNNLLPELRPCDVIHMHNLQRLHWRFVDSCSSFYDLMSLVL